MRLKPLALLLCTVLLFSSTGALAAVDIPAEEYAPKYPSAEAVEGFSLEKSIESGIRSEINDEVKSGGFSAPGTNDVVTIAADGEINVATEEAISISVRTPFGMLAFTQDLLAQLDVYAMLDDPASIVEELKRNGVHIYLVDLVTSAEVYVSTGTNIISSLVNDLDRMTDAELDALIGAIARLEPSAKVYATVYGDHTYIVYDYRDSGSQVVIYTATKNNVNINFQLSKVDGTLEDQQLEDMKYLLEDVKLSIL